MILIIIKRFLNLSCLSIVKDQKGKLISKLDQTVKYSNLGVLLCIQMIQKYMNDPQPIMSGSKALREQALLKNLFIIDQIVCKQATTDTKQIKIK